MICPECGKEVRDDARYCPECGAYIEGTPDHMTDSFDNPPVPGGRPDETTRKRRRRRALIIGAIVAAAIMVAGIGISIMSVTRAFNAINDPHPVTFTVDIKYYDEHGSRIPIEITGKDSTGNEIKETVYLGYIGEEDCDLKTGSYHARVLGSPITAKGRIYEIPDQTFDFEVPNNLKPGEGYAVKSGDAFKFEPVKASEMTDEQIEDAVEWARKDEDLDVDVDALEKAAYKRREDAKAGIDVDFEVQLDTPPSGIF